MFDARLHQTNGGMAAESLRPVLPGREECPLFAHSSRLESSEGVIEDRAVADVAVASKAVVLLATSPADSHSSGNPALRNPSARAGGTKDRSISIFRVSLGLARSASARTDFASSILPWSA